MNTFKQLREVMAVTLRVPAEQILESTISDDIPAWDSLGHVNLMMALEQTYEIFLDVEDFPKMNSVRAITEYLNEHGIG